MPKPPPILLTIAGFDPSSGAGVTADLQVFAAHGCFGTAAITALTVQSTRGVVSVQAIDADVLRSTLAELQVDLPPAGIKIGMLGSAPVVNAVADFLQSMRERPPVVLDPVLRASSGSRLLATDASEVLAARLLPLVDWITPNWMELEVLSGVPRLSEGELEAALQRLGSRYPGLGIVATGGDQTQPVDIVRFPDGRIERVRGKHVETASTHGTGCAYSSAMLCGLVAGADALDAARAAKRYVEGALRHAPGLGSGHGPMELLWRLRQKAQASEPPDTVP